MSVASIIARAQGLGTDFGDDARRGGAAAAQRPGRVDRRGRASPSPTRAPTSPASAPAPSSTATSTSSPGEKRWIGNAKAADFIQLLCRTDDPEPGEKRAAGLATLIVEKDRGTFPAGLTGTHDRQDRLPRLPDLEPRLRRRAGAGGEPGRRRRPAPGTSAFRDTQKWLNIARVHTAARAVGLARAAVEDSVLYLQEREQFGHPIGDFQALRFMLATMAARVEQARAFYRQVADLLDRGEPCERESAMVKLVATEMAVDVTSDAMQLHGGNGYTTERQVERYWRDARLTTIFEGTSQIQQKIIADSLLPRSPLELSSPLEARSVAEGFGLRAARPLSAARRRPTPGTRRSGRWRARRSSSARPRRARTCSPRNRRRPTPDPAAPTGRRADGLRVQPPLQVVALDDQRAGDLALHRALPHRPDVDQPRAALDARPRPGRASTRSRRERASASSVVDGGEAGRCGVGRRHEAERTSDTEAPGSARSGSGSSVASVADRRQLAVGEVVVGHGRERRRVGVHADRRLVTQVADVVHVAGREPDLRTRGPLAGRAACAAASTTASVSEPRQHGERAGRAAVVVQFGALARAAS